MGTLCRQSYDSSQQHAWFQSLHLTQCTVLSRILSYRMHSWSWSLRHLLCTCTLKLMGHRVGLCCALIFQHQRPHVSITKAKMKDAIFFPCLLPALCLRPCLGKRETWESALFHGGTVANCFPGKGQQTPILYGNDQDSALQPLLKD